MSTAYTDAELSSAFNQGHNDAWEGKRPVQWRVSDQRSQKYRQGHVAGVTARYWYDKGVASCA